VVVVIACQFDWRTDAAGDREHLSSSAPDAAGDREHLSSCHDPGRSIASSSQVYNKPEIKRKNNEKKQTGF
jgi:hypothetical protein